jgi:hypothetical protein
VATTQQQTDPEHYHCGHCNQALDYDMSFFQLPATAAGPATVVVILPLRCPSCGRAIAQLGTPSRLVTASGVPRGFFG